MVRDLGARRQPPAVLLIGGGLVFAGLCYLLNRRDRIRRHNLDQPLPAKVEARTSADADESEKEKVGAGV
jgi:hypothetical protein